MAASLVLISCALIYPSTAMALPGDTVESMKRTMGAKLSSRSLTINKDSIIVFGQLKDYDYNVVHTANLRRNRSIFETIKVTVPANSNIFFGNSINGISTQLDDICGSGVGTEFIDSRIISKDESTALVKIGNKLGFVYSEITSSSERGFLVYITSPWRLIKSVGPSGNWDIGSNLEPTVPTFIKRNGRIFTTRTVELRNDASNNSTLISNIPPGTILEELEISGYWAKVKTRNGTIGYIPTIEYL